MKRNILKWLWAVSGCGKLFAAGLLLTHMLSGASGVLYAMLLPHMIPAVSGIL